MDIKTNEQLLLKIRGSIHKPQTAEDLDRQRLSYVMGMLPAENVMTREQVQHVIERHEGRRLSAG